MSFIIAPLESILNPPELVCCVDGKTTTESLHEDFSANFTEVTLANADGKNKTTWTTISDDEGITAFNFYLCCSRRVVAVWTSTVPSAVFTAAVLFEGNGESGYGGKSTPGGWTWDSDIDPFQFSSKPDLTIREMNSPCGLKIYFELSSLGVGEVLTLSLTY